MTVESFTIQDIEDFRNKLLNFLKDEPVFCLLDSNDYYSDKNLGEHPYYHDYDLVCAIGAGKILKCHVGIAFHQLEIFRAQNPDSWIFGYFGYDLKNEIEKLKSENQDHLDFEDMFFFVPETVLLLKGKEVWVEGSNAPVAKIFPSESHTVDSEAGRSKPSTPDPQSPFQKTLRERKSDAPTPPFGHPSMKMEGSFKARIDKESYLETVEKLRQHIIEGDVYEVSFCQEFYSDDGDIEPFTVFKNLCDTSPQPFGSLMRMNDKYIICASMERYLKKSGNKLISQPIKGTIRRGKDATEDDQLKKALLNDEKERAENVMIVDLVRNDLSRTCIPGTVKVEELFGIYNFPGVFQMISTVTGELLPDKTGLDAVKASFPMGSMTGAPKIMAMKIIEQYEQTKRGIYSGAL